MKLYAGATTERFPGDKYFKALEFVEYAPRQPLPRAATLRRLAHQQRPAEAHVALRVPRSAIVSEQGPLRPTEEQQARLAWTLEAADILTCSVVILPTPASLTPGARNRGLLAQFVDALPRPIGRHYVWAPSGVWEEAESAAVAHSMGIVRSFDPRHETCPPGPVAYAQMHAIGGQTSFSEALMAETLAAFGAQPGLETAYVSLESDRSFEQAKRIRALATGGDNGSPR